MKWFLTGLGGMVALIASFLLWPVLPTFSIIWAVIATFSAIGFIAVELRNRHIKGTVELIQASKIHADNAAVLINKQLIQLQPAQLGYGVISNLHTYSPHQELITPAMATSAALEAPQLAIPALPDAVDLLEALAKHKPNKAELEVIFGIAADGKPIIKPFGADTLHIANAGASGAGKSAAAQSIMFQLALADKQAERVKFAFIDTEGKTSKPFKNAEHTLFLAQDGQEAAEVLQEIENIVAIRAKMSEDDLEAEPILAVLLEEFLSLKDELGKEDWSRLIRIITKARKSKVFLLCLSQTFYSDNDTRTFKGQLRTRNCFKLEDKGTYQAFGVNEPEAISRLLEAPAPGRFLHRTPSGLVLAQSPFVAPRTIAEYFEKPKVTQEAVRTQPEQSTARPASNVVEAKFKVLTEPDLKAQVHWYYSQKLSIRQIAEKLGVTKYQVEKSLAELRSAGLVV